MKNIIKKVAAINDLSGFGRSSLTTIIPIMSNMGIQVCPLPTAILSTHTGGFNDFSFVDFTDNMTDFINHWKALGLKFDCIYSGFLGSSKQIDIVSDFIDFFGNNKNLVVIDPVMGDDGSLYNTMENDIVSKMKKLIEKADIITPNFTELCLLLNKKYRPTISENEIKKWIFELSKTGPDIIIVTSVPEEKNSLDEFSNVIAFDKKNNIFWKTKCKLIPIFYPGTGDSFTSVLIGSLLQEDSLPRAIEKATNFINQCIRSSSKFDYPNREGILLEKMLPILNHIIIENNCELLKNNIK